MKVSIFGGSKVNDFLYSRASEVGKIVASRGYEVYTGGYGGSMEAVSMGCKKSKGHSVGVCIKGHVIDNSVKPNKHNGEIILADSLLQRIEMLLESDAVIILDGSLGTLQELVCALANNYLSKKPKIIIFSKKFKDVVNYFKKKNLLKDIYPSIIFVNNLKELSKIL